MMSDGESFATFRPSDNPKSREGGMTGLGLAAGTNQILCFVIVTKELKPEDSNPRTGLRIGL